MDSRQEQGRVAVAANVQARLLEWRRAQRDVELLRQVSLDEAEARARRAGAEYLAAVGPASSESLGSTPAQYGDDEDTTWMYETDWAP